MSVSLESPLEQLVEERQRILRVGLIGIVLWQGTTIARNSVPQWGHSALLIITGLVGAGLFAWAMLRLMRVGKKLQGRPSLLAAFNDEWVEQNRLLALKSALLAVIGLQGLWIATLSFLPHLVSPLVVAETTLLVGTAVGIGAFLRRDAQ